MAGAGLFVAATFSLARGETGAIYDPSFHQVGGTLFFGGTALGLIALSRRLARDPQWRNLSRYCLGSGLASIAGGVVLNALAIPDDAPLHGEVGLIQRIIVLAFIFPALITLGNRLRRFTAQPSPQPPPSRPRHGRPPTRPAGWPTARPLTRSVIVPPRGPYV